ncbi:MAG: hypothetical protein UH241_08195, partial [Acutalibacteraceae bacterium]|nr:hypothetical protein [Acutalibacteraceae bacterium]
IVMYKEGEIKLDSVKVDDVNVLESKKTVSQSSLLGIGEREYVVFDVVAYGEIDKIEIFHAGEVLGATKENNGTEGHYTITCDIKEFVMDRIVYIRVFAKSLDGNSMDPIVEALKLNILRVPTLTVNQLPIINSTKIDIGEGKEDIFKLMTGVSLSFEGTKVSDISIVYDYAENKHIITFGMDPEKLPSWEKAGGKKIAEQLRKKVTDKLGDKKKLGFNLQGVVEVGITDQGLLYIIKGSATLQASLELLDGSARFQLGIYPMVFGFQIKGSASVTGGFEINLTSSGLESIGFICSQIALGLEVNLTLGMGTRNYSAGIYGKLNLNVSLEYTGKMIPLKVIANGEVGAYMKILAFNSSSPIVSTKDFQIFPRNNDAKAKAISNAMAAMYSTSSYSANNKILSYNATWDTPILANTGTTTLLDNVYAYSAPQIITCGNDTIMLYLGTDKTSEKAVNAMALYCSVYNKESGKWGVPTKIDNNNQLDMSYSICTDGEKIYLVYSQANKVFDDNATIEDMAASGDIYTAVFDSITKRFTNITQLTNNNMLDCESVVKIINGIPTLVWVNNPNNNIFLTDSGNSIMMSTCENGVWSSPTVVKSNLNTVQNLNVIETSKGATVVYTTDSDNDLTTHDDKTLYCHYNKLGKTVEIDSQLETAVIVDNLVNSPVAMWYKNGTLKQCNLNTTAITDIVSKANADIANGFKLVTDNNGNYAIVYVKDKNTVQAMYLDPATLKWTTPVKVATSENDIENLEAQYVNGELTLMYHDTKAVPNGETYDITSKMVTTVVSSNAQAVIDDIEIDYYSIAPDQKTKATVTVTNTGAKATGNLTFNVTNYNGMNLGTYTTSDVSLKSGETGTYEVEFTVPSTIVKRGITISVTDSNKDYT